ncbi:MAG: methylenetetrahydrofolate reductase [Galactobacter sp.]|uniref:methylenetetrahydrofolate reductase n=1 Tax=Galactobacter sp. TaxID=2676125 RepID=UPI0025BA77BD|nr:methylenetetrahydrofolate reductase [Galactobacter sp.]
MAHEHTAAADLVKGFSLEMTGKDIEPLREAAPFIPQGTRVNVTFLGNEDLQMRVAASAEVKRLGFVPVPHLSARRLHDEDELATFLDELAKVDAAEHVFSVGGDPAEPLGPFPDALTVIKSGALQKAGVKSVAISGYPEGHPDIAENVLWEHLEAKSAALAEAGLDATILTQFSFDADAVLAWIAEVRRRGITAPIRVGIPGPAGIKRLLGYAKRFGVGSSAGIVKKYGFSLTHLIGSAGPDKFVADLAAGLAQLPNAGEVGVHLYTFGGLKASAQWASAAQEASA